MARRISRIRLIEPRAAGFHVFSRVRLPRLGLPIMGSILRDAGFDVRIYCQDIRDIDYADLFQADLVGISTTTSTAPEAYRIADRLKERGIPVVMGGSHATFLPEEALEHAPYCVRGEGEHVFLELVNRLADKGDLSDIAGLSYCAGSEIRHNPPQRAVDDLDSLPIPDLDLIHGRERIWMNPIMTSRGCPYSCTFCSVTQMFGRKYRYRSTQSVIEELSRLPDKFTFFYDDNLTANRERAKALFEEMIRKNLSLAWSAQTRADVGGEPELLALMKRAGCVGLYIGFESVNPDTLEALRKRQAVEEIQECVCRLHEHGISVHGMFITGADQDDEHTIRETARFALRHRIDTVQIAILTPLPGTRLQAALEKEGRIFSRDWSLYDGHHVVFQPARMSPYTLQLETYKALARFYTLWQCVKLAARLKLIPAFLRYCGNRQVKRWHAANRDFIRWIRSISEKTRKLATPAQTTAGRS